MPRCGVCKDFVSRKEYRDHYEECLGVKKPSTASSSKIRQPSISEMFKKPVIEAVERPVGGSYPICGVTVKFPYKPYPQQIIFMQRVIKALKGGDHALLESPTGTGKTLSLLCAALAWQQQAKIQIEAEQKALCPVHDVEEEDVVPVLWTPGSEGTPVKLPVAQLLLRGFGTITSVSVHNPTKKKKQMTQGVGEKRKVHIFIEDDRRSVKVLKVDVDADQVGNCLRLVEVVDQRSIFVQIPPSGVTMIRKKLFRGLEAGQHGGHETWLLDPPLTKNTEKLKSLKQVDWDDDDFKSSTTPLKNIETPLKSPKASNGAAASSKEEQSPGCAKAFTSPVTSVTKDKVPPKACICSEKRKKFPKIYFGTRTHKQVKQVIRELRKTQYHQVKMSILSSREYSCINPKLQKEGVNKNEKCQELRKEKLCQYGLNSKLLGSHKQLAKRGVVTAWDIEDLNNVGRANQACSYYAAVDLAGTADIIFCPYNYLVDPLIVGQRNLDLEGHIVIFDEGHNIESQCTDGASYSVNQIELGAAITNLDDTLKRDDECWTLNKEDPERGEVSVAKQMRGIKSFLVKLQNFALSYEEKLIDDYFEHSHYTMGGSLGVKAMEAVGITKELVDQVAGWMNSIIEIIKSSDQEVNIKIVPKSATLIQCEKFCICYNIIMGSRKPGMDLPYNFTLIKEPMLIDDPHSKSRKQHRTMAITLNMWCLDPSLIFNPMGQKCHSIIVTSGTLSPMDTFQSELGTDFKVKLEGKHVVPKSNFVALNLTTGPNGHSLNAAYKNADTYNFQDDIGEIVSKACSIVPHGVLVFVPSYRMLEKLSERWRMTGRWDTIAQTKMVFMEPRASAGKKKFESLMADFDNHVEEGALLLAVCRGKISEGADFSNNTARAVITVGIPFPNFKEEKVIAKRVYNDRYSSSLGLLKGQQWYTIQGFRALNQALGRCLRHVNDWGAIIIIEERIDQNKRYKESVSKWIRDELLPVECNEAFDRLETFVNDKLGREDQASLDGQTSVLDPDVTLEGTPSGKENCGTPSRSKDNVNSTPLRASLTNLVDPFKSFSGVIDIPSSPEDLPVSPIKHHEVNGVPLFSNKQSPYKQFVNSLANGSQSPAEKLTYSPANIPADKLARLRSDGSVKASSSEASTDTCEKSEKESEKGCESSHSKERDLNSSSPELFGDEDTKLDKPQYEETDSIVKLKEGSDEFSKALCKEDFEAMLEEDMKDEVKRHHSPEQLDVVTKRRRVSRLKGAVECTAGHRELVKEGADRTCLRAQDLLHGSYTTLDTTLHTSSPSISHASTMTVVEGIVLGCARCGARIGEMLVEIRAEGTIARVRLDES